MGFFLIHKENMYRKAFPNGKDVRQYGWLRPARCIPVAALVEPRRAAPAGARKALPGNPAALAGAQRPLRVPSSIGEVLLCSGGSGALPGCGASRVCAAGLPAEKAGWERG